LIDEDSFIKNPHPLISLPAGKGGRVSDGMRVENFSIHKKFRKDPAGGGVFFIRSCFRRPWRP